MIRLQGTLAIAVKYLAAVDVDARASNQHEITGNAAWTSALGSVRRHWEQVPWLLLSDDGVHTREVFGVTWYDTRQNQPLRSAEWRLYYGPGRTGAEVGSLCMIVGWRDELAVLCAPAGSSWESQLLSLFDSPSAVGQFVSISTDAIAEPYRELIEELSSLIGWDVVLPPVPGIDIEMALSRFGSTFPSTDDFSAFVRESIQSITDPDDAIEQWWTEEERLFRALERLLVEDKIRRGFTSADEFFSYSLSVQNRRKARAGSAFENHIKAVLEQHSIRFSWRVTTEGRRRPDFIFPGIAQYHDPSFDAARLSMLGAKTTCKDRWRQVINEAARVSAKHLCTLEPAISSAQLAEMGEEGVTLVAPRSIVSTYRPPAGTVVLTIRDFVDVVSARQTLP